MHQAGSDSLLTAQTFFRLCAVSFNGLSNLSDEKFKGELFGYVPFFFPSGLPSFPPSLPPSLSCRVLFPSHSRSSPSPFASHPSSFPPSLPPSFFPSLRLGHNHTVYRNKMQQATNRQQQGHGHGGK